MTDPSEQTIKPAGWSSFLTWRRPTIESKIETSVNAPMHSSSENANLRSPKSTTFKLVGSPARQRAPIPFQLADSIPFTPRSPRGEKGRSEHASSSSESLDEDLHEVSAAFENLARVKQKDRHYASTISKGRTVRLEGSPFDSSPATHLTQRKALSGGWLTWGTSTFRSNVLQGGNDRSEPEEYHDDETSMYLESETFHSPRASIATIEKSWKPLMRDEIDQCVDRMLTFAGIDGE